MLTRSLSYLITFRNKLTQGQWHRTGMKIRIDAGLAFSHVLLHWRVCFDFNFLFECCGVDDTPSTYVTVPNLVGLGQTVRAYAPRSRSSVSFESSEPTSIDALPMTFHQRSIVSRPSRAAFVINDDFGGKSQIFPTRVKRTWFPFEFCNVGGIQKTLPADRKSFTMCAVVSATVSTQYRYWTHRQVDGETELV